MAYVVQERPRGQQTWQTMSLADRQCEMPRQNAECAAYKLRKHFSEEFEYRVIEKLKVER